MITDKDLREALTRVTGLAIFRDPIALSFKELKQLVEALPTPVKEPEWISVNDRLPEMYEEVLVLNRGKVNMSRRYPCRRGVDTNWQYKDSYLWTKNLTGVTHWMPMIKGPM